MMGSMGDMTSQAGQADDWMNNNLSDVELLTAALQDAREAHGAGLIVGPDVDEVALRRAVRRAWRADVARALRVVGRGGAA